MITTSQLKHSLAIFLLNHYYVLIGQEKIVWIRISSVYSEKFVGYKWEEILAILLAIVLALLIGLNIQGGGVKHLLVKCQEDKDAAASRSNSSQHDESDRGFKSSSSSSWSLRHEEPCRHGCHHSRERRRDRHHDRDPHNRNRRRLLDPNSTSSQDTSKDTLKMMKILESNLSFSGESKDQPEEFLADLCDTVRKCRLDLKQVLRSLLVI